MGPGSVCLINCRQRHQLKYVCYISDHTSSSSSSSIIYDERLLRSLMKIISTVSSVDEGRGCSSSRGASSSSPSALPSTGIKWWSLSFVIDIVRHHAAAAIAAINNTCYSPRQSEFLLSISVFVSCFRIMTEAHLFDIYK